ncbi:hypothetical protein [Paraburkholderia acidisoli]|uniref:Uncharacterized protein n=1 Tax=Paraburkholderia acidisoli TaxID=2571748 RepID=A0A7Z2GR94_9BURK|nr:hypothetical protein [Paraburkholderia acidisoli]QGZ66326.1 hypothetical protein FAZ98_31525 [Paraburkholderia acidisoli]QGZ66409.1 hypothetical protein FAZ98_32005 [Paraburkholderia acidisoli]
MVSDINIPKRLRDRADLGDMGRKPEKKDLLRIAADLIEQQARDLAALRQDIEAQIQIAKEARERAEENLKDAKRYRWLRSRTRCFALDMGGKHRYDPSGAFLRLAGPSIDDAFDAAIEKDSK